MKGHHYFSLMLLLRVLLKIYSIEFYLDLIQTFLAMFCLLFTLRLGLLLILTFYHRYSFGNNSNVFSTNPKKTSFHRLGMETVHIPYKFNLLLGYTLQFFRSATCQQSLYQTLRDRPPIMGLVFFHFLVVYFLSL